MTVRFSLALGLLLSLQGCLDGTPAQTAGQHQICERAEIHPADGHVLQRSTTVFDGQGRLSESTLEFFGASSLSNGRLTVTYEGTTEVWSYDDFNDGSVDGTRTFERDAAGRLVTMTRDGLEGWRAGAQSMAWTYDADGRTSTVDAIDAHGKPINIAFSYDAAGRLAVHTVRSTNADDTPAIDVARLTRDDEGRLVRVDTYRDDNAVPALVYVYAYDDAGRLSVSGVGSSADTILETYTRTYNADGQVVAARWDSQLDGVDRHTYTYRDDGTLATATTAHGEDGPPHRTVTFEGCGLTAPDHSALGPFFDLPQHKVISPSFE